MNTKMLLFHLAIRWILLTVVSASIFPALERGATDMSINPGENAMFECDLKHTGGYPIVWFHQETGRYIDDGFINSGSQDHTRYHTAQNLSAEIYKLWIMDVRFSDTGTYACVWKGKCAIPMDWVQLTVIGAPTVPTDDKDYTLYSSSRDDDDDDTKFPSTDNNSLDPICEISYTTSDLYDNVGQDFILICKSPPQIGRSTVEWYRNDAESMTGPFDTNVVYQRYLTQQDVDAIYTCVLRSPHLQESRNCSVGPVTYLSSVSASVSFSKSSHGNATFASISATLGVVCVILVAVLLYVVINNKKKRTVSYQQVPTVSGHISPSPEGYMALENQYQPPKYQPLKAPSNGRITRKPTIEPPPRKARKPKYPPPKHKSSAVKQTPNTNSNATYAVPNISYLSVPVDIKHSRDDVSEHSYEVPPC